ncbi:MAG: SUMF1/EgtB/PvdO family nonheme iron enzyme [Bacteroidota bacterium]
MRLSNKRKQHIENRLEELFEMVLQWEEKRDLSENPNERRRSEIEINRIQDTITQYREELAGGIPVVEDKKNPIKGPDLKKVNRQWILGVLTSILLLFVGYNIYLEMTKVEPDYDEYMKWLVKGDSLLLENQIQEAGIAYEKALEYNPLDARVLEKIDLLSEAKELIQNEKFEEAQKRFKVIINIPPAVGLIAEASTESMADGEVQGMQLQLSFSAEGLEISITGGVPFDDPQQPYLLDGLDVCSDCIAWSQRPNGEFLARVRGITEVEITLVVEDSKGNKIRERVNRTSSTSSDQGTTPEEPPAEDIDPEALFIEAKENGDMLYNEKEFGAAIDAYKEALTYKENDSYCLQQIRICEEKVKKGEIAAAKQIPLIKVSGGSFRMGREDGFSNELPVHEVALSPFRISQTEVTVKQYQKFCKLTGRKMPKTPSWGWKEDDPIVNVSWQDAQAYCNWVGGRLPTEAEWEYAARGGEKQIHSIYSGGEVLSKVSWYKQNAKTTQTAKSKSPNALGIYGLTGNAAEWCLDRYSSKYYASSPLNNPMGPSQGRRRVVRGGSYLSDPNSTQDGDQLRLTYRNYKNEEYSDNYIGFRVVKPQ